MSPIPAPALIPRPLRCQTSPGFFELSPETRIIADQKFSSFAELFAERLRKSTGWSFEITVKEGLADFDNAIAFQKASDPMMLEAYRLQARENGVVITAESTAVR